ncbi:DinB family protein [Bacillus carboniphilus]|uniref:DinB family protein n=1 Tax=Bacillus carboniphilus TaxID=86663 RepID=A0ABY9JS95_9BACI|nr:DinB family protein [Bacillus carboniphilus]WLR42279.1 DinB family protein [Bacillus carboniphilus]
MNACCNSVMKQIYFVIQTIIEMIDQIEEVDLEKRPSVNKHSIGELLSHMATICEADLLISDQKSSEEMERYYSGKRLENKNQIKNELLANVHQLQARYSSLSECELFEKTTSYWGVTYTRFEWLVEILSHLYHHRGQLHAILVHYYKKELTVSLFE